MSSNTTTLDFASARVSGRRPKGFLSLVNAFWESVRLGLAASHHYSDLTARGTPPQQAVDIVYRTHFAKLGQ